MTYDMEALRKASERVGLPFGYMQRLAAADDDPQDPAGDNTLARQIAVMFDHYLAKGLAGDDPIGALRQFGFEETADALEGRLS